MRPIAGSAISICLIWAVLTLPFDRPVPACAAGTESKSCELVVEALGAATKLKAGMLRADLEKDFELDGGLSVQNHATYTYRHCHYIKMNVEFAIREQNPGTYTFSPDDQISKISSPYLAYPVSD